MNATAIDPWIVDLFRTVDAMDTAGFAKAFTDEGSLRFANSEPVIGRDQVEASLAAFFASIGGLSHDILGVWSGHWDGGEVRSVESTVTYTRRDGTKTPAIPVTSTIRLIGDRIADYRIYMDLAPLFAV